MGHVNERPEHIKRIFEESEVEQTPDTELSEGKKMRMLIYGLIVLFVSVRSVYFNVKELTEDPHLYLVYPILLLSSLCCLWATSRILKSDSF